ILHTLSPKERDEILKMKSDLFSSARENKGPWPTSKGFFAEILMEIDKMLITDDLKRTKIFQLVEQEMAAVMKETKSDEKTPLVWQGRALPESRQRKKRADRVVDDEDSSERKKRNEKAKKRRENLARAKKLEEESLKVMTEIEEGGGPEDKKEETRRMARDKRRSDQRRRRSAGRKRRE
ncbi:hypothetical protein PENTCL1PPCAC_10828, partial [Pristionchus entomophagus]